MGIEKIVIFEALFSMQVFKHFIILPCVSMELFVPSWYAIMIFTKSIIFLNFICSLLLLSGFFFLGHPEIYQTKQLLLLMERYKHYIGFHVVSIRVK